MKTSPKRAKLLVNKAIKMLKGRMPKASKECSFCEWVKKSKV